MTDLFTLDLWTAILAIVLLDIVLGVEPVLALRRDGAGERSALARRVAGALVMLATRLAVGALLVWLVGRTDALLMIGDIPVTVHRIVLAAAGGVLLVRAFSEMGHLGYHRSAHQPAASAQGVTAAALLASVEPAVLGFALAPTLPVLMIALTLGTLGLAFLSVPLARLVNRFPHLRLFALLALAVVGATLVAGALTGQYAPAPMQAFVIAVAVIAVVIGIVVRMRDAEPALAIIDPMLMDRGDTLHAPAHVPPRAGPDFSDATSLSDTQREPRFDAPLSPGSAGLASGAPVILMPDDYRDTPGPAPGSGISGVDSLTQADHEQFLFADTGEDPAHEPGAPLPTVIDTSVVDDFILPDPQGAAPEQPDSPGILAPLAPIDRPVPERISRRQRILRGPARRRLARKEAKRP